METTVSLHILQVQQEVTDLGEPTDGYVTILIAKEGAN